ncbi:MAG TPA: hypothetical protein VFA12_20035 [Stellaceae bacterium]|nr:hypothetical protein [Stellaceae bacterium]
MQRTRPLGRKAWRRIAAALGFLACLVGPIEVAGACTLPADTTNRLGRMQVFDYAMSDASALINRDMTWASDNGLGPPSPTLPQGVWSSAYTTFAVDYHPGNSLSWWQANHPGCIVYQSDHKTIAYMFGGPPDAPSVPFAFWKSECQQVELAYILSEVRYGYNSISLDNLDAVNTWGYYGTCSVALSAGTTCEGGGGTFTQRFTGGAGDPQYVADVASWVQTVRVAIEGVNPNTCLMGNLGFSAQHASDVVTIAKQLDVWFNEDGWWFACGPWDTQDNYWQILFAVLATLSIPGYVDNNYMTDIAGGGGGNCHSAPSQPGAEALEFVIASDMLIKGNHTYLALSAYHVAQYEDYGLSPWWYLNHGPAQGPYSVSGGIYSRQFANALVLVNPPGGAVATYNLGSTVYWRMNGLRMTGTITMQPGTGLVLMTSPPAANGSVAVH